MFFISLSLDSPTGFYVIRGSQSLCRRTNRLPLW